MKNYSPQDKIVGEDRRAFSPESPAQKRMVAAENNKFLLLLPPQQVIFAISIEC